MTRIAAFLIALSLSLSLAPAPAAADKPRMPEFVPELQPFVGTWMHLYKYKGKKKVELWLVIKEDDGKLRLRYQLPVRDKKETSDWDGQIELDMQVNIKQKHRTEYRAVADPPRIEISDVRRFTGSWDTKSYRIEGYYEIDADGKLALNCVERVELKDDKVLPCFSPMTYERKSDSTRWPD